MRSEYITVAFNASRAAFRNCMFLLDQRIVDHRFECAVAAFRAANDQYMAALDEWMEAA